eukprot:CAMPEP_0182427246 /NCGR_PEP_ID=MMETSP1167-20130531/16262_1 /TAXON_ID=2988 /ORGANISM="Mallomonas Sp, Strain CCMP3275" /LENGTH=504 /DNA_ID=CAMNT_0024609353 /DNA_START=69 /DNA_END=1583 /DNA_ORIENTATION=-
MQFTPQQIAGGPRFSAATRIGNWYEDISLENAKVNEFQGRAKSGSLQVKKLRDKIAKCSQQVPHTFSEDGVVRFGDYIVLEHDNTGCTLACDPFYELTTGMEKYHVSGSREATQCARNTFRVFRPPSAHKNADDDEDDPVLRIGQSFCLGCNESLLTSEKTNILAPQLYLCSTIKNDRNATKTSNKQMVYLSPYLNSEAVWQVTPPSYGKAGSCERILAVGSPVFLDDAFVIQHKQTYNVVTVNPANKEITDFGPEFEVFGDYVHSTGKLSLMEYETMGISTATSLLKADVPYNIWHFVGAKDMEAARESRVLPPTASVDTVLDDLYRHARSLGIGGFIALRSRLQDLDRRSGGDGKLDKEDVKSCLTKWGCSMEYRYLDMVLDDLSRVGTFIDYRDFLRAVRGPISSGRKEAVRETFGALDIDGLGAIPTDQMVSHFDVSAHPLIEEGYSQSELREQLKSCFMFKGRQVPSVRYPEFEEYCADISAGIDDDENFVNMMSRLFV